MFVVAIDPVRRLGVRLDSELMPFCETNGDKSHHDQYQATPFLRTKGWASRDPPTTRHDGARAHEYAASHVSPTD
jgi:hypothetical protein